MDEAVITNCLSDDSEEALISSRVGGTLRFSDQSCSKVSFASSADSDSFCSVNNSSGGNAGAAVKSPGVGATSTSVIRSWSKCSESGLLSSGLGSPSALSSSSTMTSLEAATLSLDIQEIGDDDDECCSPSSSSVAAHNAPLGAKTVVSPKRGPQRVIFEIISARTVAQGRKKFVNYTLLVKRVPGLERKPGVLERRYSDFLNLYSSLKKRYPSFLHDFPFPSKTFLGNFTAEVITERSVAFQHLLALAFSCRQTRFSSELAEFLYDRELQAARRLMKQGQFEEAGVIFENAYFVQEKVLGEANRLTYATLCILVACLNAVDNVAEAQKYAELALAQSAKHETDTITYSLLVLSLRLWWAVGKDKRELENKVHTLKTAKGVNVDKLPTLLELVLQIDD